MIDSLEFNDGYTDGLRGKSPAKSSISYLVGHFKAQIQLDPERSSDVVWGGETYIMKGTFVEKYV